MLWRTVRRSPLRGVLRRLRWSGFVGVASVVAEKPVRTNETAVRLVKSGVGALALWGVQRRR